MMRLDGSNLIKLTYGRPSEWPYHYPACGGYGAQVSETSPSGGAERYQLGRFAYLDPPT